MSGPKSRGLKIMDVGFYGGKFKSLYYILHLSGLSLW